MTDVLTRNGVQSACDTMLRSQPDFLDFATKAKSNNVKAYAIVGFYPHHTHLFFQHIVPSLKVPVVACVVDHDRVSQCVSFLPTLAQLQSENVAHWFVENCRVSPPLPHNVTLRPIGVSWNHFSQVQKYAVPFQQICADTPGVGEKPLRILANFHHLNHARPASGMPGNERRDTERLLRCNELVTFDKKREQVECWKIHCGYTFEISPHGNGLDCHRTWEALLLNTIPIVPRSPLNELHKQFPIVIVDDWSTEITLANLLRWRDELAPQFTSAMKERLTSEYWATRMRTTQRDLRSKSATD